MKILDIDVNTYSFVPCVLFGADHYSISQVCVR